MGDGKGVGKAGVVVDVLEAMIDTVAIMPMHL